jgi:hypothetical protein
VRSIHRDGLQVKRGFSRKRQAIAIVVFVAILFVSIAQFGVALPTRNVVSGQAPISASSQPSYYRATRSYTGVPYDEQSGITFTQDFSSLTFNVTAVAQQGADGNGPGYLLSGMTDAYYWYQVGLSYNWPNTNGGYLSGFYMNYEVFDNFGNSVFPAGGGGGIANVTVHAGDTVLLSLNFTTTGDVAMTAHDWTTGSTESEYYSQEGDPYFVGMPDSVSQSGYFTGLMTEQYYSEPFTGSGQNVTYSDTDFNYSSAWLWIDEWNTQAYGNPLVFSAQTGSPVVLNGSTNSSMWPAYLSSNGTAEAANVHDFATDLRPVLAISVDLNSPPKIQPGGSATLNLTFQNSDHSTARLTNITLTTDFGIYNIAGTISLSNGTTIHSITIIVPSNVTSGDHTVTVEGIWEVFDPQLDAWISPGSLETSTLLPVTTTPPTSTKPSAGLLGSIQSFLPEILSIIAGVVVGAVLTFTLTKRRQIQMGEQAYVPPVNSACPRCGQTVAGGMMFCPNCGMSLTLPVSQPVSDIKNEPLGQPPG